MPPKVQSSNNSPNSMARILIIDDEPGLAELLSRFLEFDNIPAVSFSDPIEALEWFRKNHSQTEVVILDMQMPQQNGIQCLNELKAIDPKVQVAIFSGVPNIKKTAPKDRSVVQVFQKPIEFSTVVKWIASFARPNKPNLRVIYPRE